MRAHPLHKEAIEWYAPDTEAVYLGSEDDAYWHLMCELWQVGETFCIVEQDIEIHADVIRQFANCQADWCVFGYNGPGFGQPGDPVLTRSLGCVKFSSHLTFMYPFLVSELEHCSWRRLDVEMADALGARGYESCIHTPPVLQHHVYQDRCACGLIHENYPVDAEGRYDGAPA